MPLPEFTPTGNLPSGVHAATLTEILARLGSGTPERVAAGRQLAAIHRLALSTGKLRRFVVFGSFVTAKPAPGDVDVFLIMEDDFAVATVVGGAAAVFDMPWRTSGSGQAFSGCGRWLPSAGSRPR